MAEQETWNQLLNEERDLKKFQVKGVKPSEEVISQIRSLRLRKNQFLETVPSDIKATLLKTTEKSQEKKKELIIDSPEVLSLFEQELRITGCELIDIGMNLHCRMSYEVFLAYLKRASAAGVSRIILTGSNLENAATARDYCEQFYQADYNSFDMRIYYTVGLHPHEASKGVDEQLVVKKDFIAQVNDLSKSHYCVSYGECGLDYDRMLSSREVQKIVFRAQLENAIKQRDDKPIFVHLREPEIISESSPSAIDDLVSIIQSSDPTSIQQHLKNIVIHCYTSNYENLKRILDLGMSIGFTGYIANSKRVQSSGTSDAIQKLKDSADILSRIMIETDAPYMRPDKNLFNERVYKVIKKNRKGANEPASLPVTCKVLANLLELSTEQVAKSTTSSAKIFFRLDLVDKAIDNLLRQEIS